MKLDFKKFKKIECDDKSTTLQHEGGHSLKIAHKGLSPEHRAELDKLPMQLAKGGRAKFSQMYDPNIKGSKASKPAKSSNTMPGSPTEAKAAYTEPGDQGTRTGAYIPGAPSKHEPDDISAGVRNAYYGTHGKYPPCINPSCKSYGHPHPNCKCYGPSSEAGNFYLADGGEVPEDERFCDANRSHKKGCEYYADAGGPVGANPSATPPPDVDPNNTMPEPQATPGAAQELNGSQPTAQLPDDQAQQQAPPPEDYGADVDKELQTAEDAAGPSGTDIKPPEASPPPATPLQTAQNTTAMLHDESQKVQQDLNQGHIQAKTYKDLFDDKQLPGKIGTILGLMIGGAGAGLAHQPNMLMEMMNNTIQNDLKSQELSSTNKQNFMRIAQQGLLNQAHVTGLNVANATNARALAWSYAARATLHEQIQNALKLPEGSPQRAAAMQTLTVLSQGIDKKEADMFSQAGLAQAIQESAGASGNTSMMKSGFMGPQMKEMGEDIENKTIPGFPGRATAPLQPGDKAELRMGSTFDSAMNDLINFTKAHPHGTLPGSPEDRKGRALAGIVQGSFRGATNGGVYKSGEQDFINKLVPEHPTTPFNQFTVLPKLQAVKDEMASQTDAKAKSYGLKGYSGFQPSQTQNKPQYKMSGGKKYIRGPKGEAIEVK